MKALVPKIFISAASKDLGTSRRVVRDALVKLDCLPKEQSDFSLSGKSLVEHLRTLIQDSEGVIHLVGTCFGAEAPPPYTTSDRPRSYTQLEHDLALQLGKPLYVLFCAPDFPFDAHEPEPDVKSTLQLQYREELKRGGIDRRTIRSQEELRAQVLALRIVFDATRKDMARQQRRTRLIAVLATGVLVIGGVSGVLYLARQSHLNADNIQSAVAGRGEAVSQQIRESESRIKENLGQLAAASPARILTSEPKGAGVYEEIGLRQLGQTPFNFTQPAPLRVIISRPGHLPILVSPAEQSGGSFHVNLPPTESIREGSPYTCALLPLQLVWIEPAGMRMGSPLGDPGSTANERPITDVTITSGFWIAKVEVMNRAAALFIPRFADRVRNSGDVAAEGVTWSEANDFCRALTRFERAERRLPDHLEYRLPTEAEWEFACRAGTTTAFYTGEDEGSAEKAAWHRDNSAGQAQVVATKAPNRLGLFDMSGNVEEWCADWFGTYPGGRVSDPLGPTSGIHRVTRGGSYSTLLLNTARSAARMNRAPAAKTAGVGFRVVLGRPVMPRGPTVLP